MENTTNSCVFVTNHKPIEIVLPVGRREQGLNARVVNQDHSKRGMKPMMKLLSVSTLALALSVSQGHTTSVSVSLTSPAGLTWNGFAAQTVGETGTFSVAGIGTFSGPGVIENTTIPTAINPDNTHNNYLAVAGVETLMLSSQTGRFTIQWGTPDWGSLDNPQDRTFNFIQTFENGAQTGTVTGADILNALGGPHNPIYATLTASPTSPFNEIKFDSLSSPLTASPALPSFEFRIDAAGATPETSTWLMMLLGFAGLSIAAFRRKRVSVSL